MTTAQFVTIPAGAYLADYSSQSVVAVVVESDYAGAARYTRPIDPHLQKWLVPGERDKLHAAGKAIVLVYESFQSRPLQGYGAGMADAGAAALFAVSIDYPAGSVIMAAVDINAIAGPAGNVAPIWEYLRAFADSLEITEYLPGVYGDYDAIDLFVERSRLNWQMGARSFSGSRIHPAADLLQFPESWVGHGLDHYDGPHSAPGIDSNLCLRPFAAWLPHEIPAPPPPAPPAPLPIPNEQEPDMPSEHAQTIRDSRYTVVLLVGAGTPEWLTGERLAALSAAGVPGPIVCAPHPSFAILAARAGIADLSPYAT